MLFALPLQNHYGLHVQVGVLERFLAGTDLADLVVVVDAAQLGPSARVAVDRDQAAEAGHQQIPMCDLECVQQLFGLVLGGPHLHQHLRRKFKQVYL